MNDPYGRPVPAVVPGQSMETAAMVLGIMCIASAMMMTVYLPFIFGGISIICGILSMGQEKHLSSRARLGVLLSIAGLVLNVVIVATSVYTVFTNPAAYDQFNKLYEQVYGQNFEDVLSQLRNGEVTIS